MDEDVRLARSGDIDAFERLVEQQYRFIYRTAFRWLSDKSDAEDVAQIVCMKLARALQGFDGRSAFTSWLYRFTLNAVRDLQRTRQRQARQVEQMALVSTEEIAATQEDRLRLDDIWRIVMTCRKTARCGSPGLCRGTFPCRGCGDHELQGSHRCQAYTQCAEILERASMIRPGCDPVRPLCLRAARGLAVFFLILNSHTATARADGVFERDAWLGEWVAGEEQVITIRAGDQPDAIRVEGHASYGASDPDRVARGSVTVGSFLVTLEKRHMSAAGEFAFTAVDGEARSDAEGEEADCRIKMRLDEGELSVDDNGRCGGLNVSFTGLYRVKR